MGETSTICRYCKGTRIQLLQSSVPCTECGDAKTVVVLTTNQLEINHSVLYAAATPITSWKQLEDAGGLKAGDYITYTQSDNIYCVTSVTAVGSHSCFSMALVGSHSCFSTALVAASGFNLTKAAPSGDFWMSTVTFGLDNKKLTVHKV